MIEADELLALKNFVDASRLRPDGRFLNRGRRPSAPIFFNPYQRRSVARRRAQNSI